MPLASAGLELAVAVLVGLGLGYGVDWMRGGQRPVGLGIGALVGFGLGMVRFIIRANQTTQRYSEPSNEPPSSNDSSHIDR